MVNLLNVDGTISTHELCFALLRLEQPMNHSSIAVFRRFINMYAGGSNDLFHNHKSQTAYHFRYPLIQYKSLQGKAALMGINETGVQALLDLLSNSEFREICEISMGQQFAVTEQIRENLQLSTGRKNQYIIRRYIALNDHNLAEWERNQGLAARVRLLENCLVGHILKFASAVSWQLPPRSLQVEISDFSCRYGRQFGNPFLLFEVTFRSNITLPEWIGLGKAVSHDHGVVESYGV